MLAFDDGRCHQCKRPKSNHLRWCRDFSGPPLPAGQPRPRFGLVKHRVGEQIDPVELRKLAAEGATLNRAAEFLGVHWTTLERAARAHRVVFVKAFGPRYGWHGIRKS